MTQKELAERQEAAIAELKKKKGELVTKVEEREGKILELAISIANEVADKMLDTMRPCKLELPVERYQSYSLDGCKKIEACEVDRNKVIELLQESGFEVNLEPNDEEKFALYRVFMG